MNAYDSSVSTSLKLGISPVGMLSVGRIIHPALKLRVRTFNDLAKDTACEMPKIGYAYSECRIVESIFSYRLCSHGCSDRQTERKS